MGRDPLFMAVGGTVSMGPIEGVPYTYHPQIHIQSIKMPPKSTYKAQKAFFPPHTWALTKKHTPLKCNSQK